MTSEGQPIDVKALDKALEKAKRKFPDAETIDVSGRPRGKKPVVIVDGSPIELRRKRSPEKRKQNNILLITI